METINDRMEQIVNERFSGNKSAFAKAIDMSPAMMSTYLGNKRRSKPSIEMIASIIKNLDIDPYWLILGEKKTSPESSVSLSGDHNQVNGHGASGNINGASAEIAALKERNDSLERIIESKDAIIDTLRHQSETYERTIKYFTEKK